VAAAGCSSKASVSTQSTSDLTATTALAVPDEPLRADFTFEITYEEPSASNCPVRSIQFTDQSIGSPEAWKWEFPGGETSTEPNPYDATYVALAEGLVCTLVTGDARLGRAPGIRCAVEVLEA
jgi:hypothetical protein